MPSSPKLGFPFVIPLFKKSPNGSPLCLLLALHFIFLTQPLIANMFHFSPYRFASFGKYLPSAAGGPGLLLPGEARGGLGPSAWVSE